MSTGPISNLYRSDVESILKLALQPSGAKGNSAGTGVGTIDASSANSRSDSGELSPFAKVASALQQLQQSDPAKYQQVTEQIAANLESAAKSAQSDGNTSAANQLNQLAKDFTDASSSGQLPTLKDLAQATGRPHHHHSHSESADADNNSSSSSSNTASQALSQILSAYQTNAGQNESADPFKTIVDTIADAGIAGTGSQS